MDAALVFANSHLMLSHTNKLAVIAAHTDRRYLLDLPVKLMKMQCSFNYLYKTKQQPQQQEEIYWNDTEVCVCVCVCVCKKKCKKITTEAFLYINCNFDHNKITVENIPNWHSTKNLDIVYISEVVIK